MFLPSTFWGIPAFGWTDMYVSTAPIIFSTASSITFGPTEQLTPTTSASHPERRFANSAGEVP